MVKNLPAIQETKHLGWEDPLEMGMTIHSSILACSPGLLLVAKSWTRFNIWSREGNGNPLQYSCLENPMDGGAWWAAVHGVTKSRTWLRDFTFTFHFHALEKGMATHSSVLAWRIPGTGEPGGLPSMGSHRVGHDWSDLAAAAAALSYCVSSSSSDHYLNSAFCCHLWFCLPVHCLSVPSQWDLCVGTWIFHW